MNGGQEVSSSSVVAGGNAPKMLEFIEEPLNSVPEFVGLGIVWNLDFSVSLGWNDCLYIGLFDHFTQRIGIICLVSDDAIGSLTIQQVGGRGNIMRLAAGQNEAQGSTFGVGKSVDFGGQSSSGTPQSLIFSPPFPFAAC